MVRTSDFQFENVGSIPSNPIMNNIKNITFNLSFVSLISPFISNNLKFLASSPINEKKIFLKQSYILLTWFYYLNFVENKKNTSNNLKIFTLPIKRKKFTLTKAPMAHKNWSKEQYKFEYYSFIISFKYQFKNENIINSFNNALLFIFITKKSFPQFETNLLFLKSINLFFNYKDKNYFNYFKFNFDKN
uniref:Ribosomal protein S10 n=1 Tax=Halteria grandinella TaxID=5974 RepID=A0A7T0M4R0_HALGN|nr:ribosomal protein S10 [Halteria grandinella]QPL16003.1 ribosomal protein S10 [Halteria grandinella]